ncbi:cytochrome c biogenesis protein [Candidatus Gracilibacteria bacterium]|nr:cytochrome c biogenesis protein [Candidatus Gracilibacteria bacterium]
MKKFILSIILLNTFLFVFSFNAFAQSGDMILFYGNGCPHCAKVEDYIKSNNLNLNIEQKEVYQNKNNANEFNKICDKENISLMDRGVPFLYSKGQCFIGDKQIISYLSEFKGNISKEEGKKEEQVKKGFSDSLTIPFLIGAALVDAINPCEFAVLLILITTILASGNRKRALLSGLAYSLSIFISYFLMGLGIYSIILSVETSTIFIKIIGCIAILLGIFNLKDYFWYGKFFVMEVPLSWRPKLKSLVRSITGPISAFFIGILVSLFLLPCTSGPYIVILGMLGHNETYLKAVLLLLLYNVIFILPMIGITIGTYFGMNVEKAEEKRTKSLQLLHLIAGIIMLIMGIVLVTGIF